MDLEELKSIRDSIMRARESLTADLAKIDALIADETASRLKSDAAQRPSKFMDDPDIRFLRREILRILQDGNITLTELGHKCHFYRILPAGKKRQIINEMIGDGDIIIKREATGRRHRQVIGLADDFGSTDDY